MLRHDGRSENQLRSISIETNILKYPEGSVLMTFGDTKVICTATVAEKVPRFLSGTGKGWISAEYTMLPRATQTRTVRDSVKGKISGRSMEIQRLIGRSLRSVVDLELLGERMIAIDCDVIQADGGTRTASITGGFVALRLAVNWMLNKKILTEDPIREHLAAVSVGMILENQCVLDLDYQEDSHALVDMNLVMTESGKFVEIQGTGEEAAFSGDELNTLLFLGKSGIADLIAFQKESLLENAFSKEKELLKDTNEPFIVIATKNPGKAHEFKKMFADIGWQIKTLLDFPQIPEVAETGSTFEENARLKAETIALRLDCPVLADDSGLVVDAIGGLPGIYSARFAGERKSDAANNAKLLHELTDIPLEKRSAHFHCTLVLAAPNKESLVVDGDIDGQILTIPRGDNGFGYDPLFFLPKEQVTMAELSLDKKNKISHRAKAIEKMKKEWSVWWKD